MPRWSGLSSTCARRGNSLVPVQAIDHATFLRLIETAHGRSDPKTRAGLPDRDMSGRHSSLAVHLWGLLGEQATAQLLGLAVDHTSFGTRGDRKIGDLEARGPGRRVTRVQVKTRTKRGWDFALNSLNVSEFRAHYGVLCWPVSDIQFPRMVEALEEGLTALAARYAASIDVVGWIDRDDFALTAREENYLREGGAGRKVVSLEAMSTDFASLSSRLHPASNPPRAARS